jgi:hypothetical protein
VYVKETLVLITQGCFGAAIIKVAP